MNKPLSETARLAKEAMQRKTEAAPKPSPADYASTGITTLNLACYNRIYGGLQKGGIYRLIGKSGTAKTVLAGTFLAEAANNQAFHDYILNHRDTEGGRRMEAAKFWGQRAAARVQRCTSKNLLDWYKQLHKYFDKKQPVFEVVDSLDALYTDAETKMTDMKAKTHAQELRKLIAGIESTKSIVILVQHAKVNLGNTWSELITSGGASPEFYSSLDIWLSKVEQLKKSVKGVEYQVGNMYIAHVKKNRMSGQDRTIRFPFYTDYGIDDIGACIWFLCDCKHWRRGSSEKDAELLGETNGDDKKPKPGVIWAEEFDQQLKLHELVKWIEENKKQRELRELTGKVWHGINAALAQKREPRYV